MVVLMKIHILSSGSKGNAYLIEKNESCLLLECGVNFNTIKEAVNFNLLKIKAVLVSHEHQ